MRKKLNDSRVRDVLVLSRAAERSVNTLRAAAMTEKREAVASALERREARRGELPIKASSQVQKPGDDCSDIS